MNIKELKGDLKLVINGDDNWFFNNTIKFNYHVTNYSKIIIDHVIHKEMVDSNLQTINHPYLSNVDTFALATLLSNNKPIFTGIITTQGRYSLKPNTIKDKSIEIVDIRFILSKMSPTDITFENVSPLEALNDFIASLNEPKIKVGKASFSDNSKITAYDTTSKSPYSILKDIIAVQSKSFLYFSQDEQGNLLINYMSNYDFENLEPIELNKNTIENYFIEDIKIEEHTDNYFNKLRLESENIISNTPTQDYFILNNALKSVWLSEPFGLNIENKQEFKNFYYFLDRPEQKNNLEIVSKQEYTEGKNYHLYYQQDSRELVLNPDWEKENVAIYFNYYSKNRQAITLENTSEINRLHLLNGFKGDIFRYDKNNDISTFTDLFRHTQNKLDINSHFTKELKIKCDRAFLNLGDFINLDFNQPKFDGKYVVIGFSGDYLAASQRITVNYVLRNTFNSDTLINFYDSQDYKINPLIPDELNEVYKYIDKTKLKIWSELKTINKNMLQLELIKKNKLPAPLPYTHKLFIDYKTPLNNLKKDIEELETYER
ncbi:hypothetical protein [Mesomycoplasma lagogenitalium]|uniref:Uncharacterized protein n=1 Tax=Mesomycoplasma lagogenitalium TaxID=171286 RepID=A0ABY8LTA9_9BACT|nr:hypothetical protein [Mesomycoplasma lagogenitalium]WGI36479.1 hypothetical protein QEG99_03370 [Mesomycoplasma lagogenitalium]